MDRTERGRLRTRVTRRICADPTSTALLLAGPAALELWPGVRHVGEAGRRALVEAELPAPPYRALCVVPQTAATVRALPPRRTPTSFVTHFEWSGPGLPPTTGELTLTYLAGGATPATAASLWLDSADVDGSRVDRDALSAMAEGFLANLARAAERRSTAA
jgi:hypothetical protein